MKRRTIARTALVATVAAFVSLPITRRVLAESAEAHSSNVCCPITIPNSNPECPDCKLVVTCLAFSEDQKPKVAPKPEPKPEPAKLTPAVVTGTTSSPASASIELGTKLSDDVAENHQMAGLQATASQSSQDVFGYGPSLRGFKLKAGDKFPLEKLSAGTRRELRNGLSIMVTIGASWCAPCGINADIIAENSTNSNQGKFAHTFNLGGIKKTVNVLQFEMDDESVMSFFGSMFEDNTASLPVVLLLRNDETIVSMGKTAFEYALGGPAFNQNLSVQLKKLE